jgi:CheY-like chemotaxis protein/anti-sigma regulatory factor (Ser/Thr protein kinase)
VGLEFIHGRTGQVRLDATRLQQIAWNLLSNAVKFTPRGGQVEASLMRLDDRLELVVRDTGCGIAPDFLPYVFERFRQQDSTTTRRHGGLGLGLAIVKNLAELHGGWVSVESAGQGRGTTFRVSLPTDSVETRHAVPAEGSSRGEGTSRITANRERLDGVRIVVVDDDADARELMETVLIQAGAEVKTAAASSEGLQAIAELRPHLVLADIAMPEEDGYTFVRRLRNRAPEAGGATPAIAVTACAREEDRARALASGYTRHMSKPVDFAQLVTEVAHLARAGACAS